MAVNMFASKETTTSQRVPAMLTTSWRVTERHAKVRKNSISFLITQNLNNLIQRSNYLYEGDTVK